MKKIISVVGARPNFMKVAPIHWQLARQPHFQSVIVHTGQHYDARMSDIFFEQLGLPKPDYYLGIEGGDSVSQIGRLLPALAEVFDKEKPDLVIVVGDVNATAGAAFAAAHRQIPVAHIEAGLRSFDRSMPEEINRMVTDSITNYFFVTEQSAVENLRTEGVPEEKVFFVGNVMIDCLVAFRDKAAQLAPALLHEMELEAGNYVLVTMHRPSNVDSQEGLERVSQLINGVARMGTKVVWPMHPRTESRMKQSNIDLEPGKVLLIPPQGYLQFLALMMNASLLLTDSGGVQEETTYLSVPCITFRTSTERPVTVALGTNHLMKDLNVEESLALIGKIFDKQVKQGQQPPYWDGKAAERIVECIEKILLIDKRADRLAV